jgi:hypothetical protein
VQLESGWVHVRGTKRAARDRRIAIRHPALASLLDYALKHAPGEDSSSHAGPNVRQDLFRACAQAGVERCFPNDLRAPTAYAYDRAGHSAAGAEVDVPSRISSIENEALRLALAGVPHRALLVEAFKARAAAFQIAGRFEGLPALIRPMLWAPESGIHARRGGPPALSSGRAARRRSGGGRGTGARVRPEPGFAWSNLGPRACRNAGKTKSPCQGKRIPWKPGRLWKRGVRDLKASKAYLGT